MEIGHLLGSNGVKLSEILLQEHQNVTVMISNMTQAENDNLEGTDIILQIGYLLGRNEVK